jgi:hypothetical protein
MPTSRAFAYNPSENPPTGASQFGNLAVQGTGWTSSSGGLNWYNGPDEDPGYVIGYPASPPRTAGSGSIVITGTAVGFMRTPSKTDPAFVSLSNVLTGQSFLTASVASAWLRSNGYWTSYTSISDLGSLGNPAVSAQAIYNSGQITSGWYWIKTSGMSIARNVYCNMTDQGGGWMLISYNPTNTVTVGNAYPNVWTSGAGASFSNKFCVDAQDLWYNNGLAQCTQVMKMASTTASLTPLLSGMEIANKVVYNNPGNLIISRTFSTTQSAVIVNNTPMGGSWSAIKGHTLMTTTLNVNAPGDWIYLANNQWWTVCGPSTAYPDSQGRSGNAQGSGSWTNIGANIIYGMANVSTTTGSSRTDIKTYAVYIK